MKLVNTQQLNVGSIKQKLNDLLTHQKSATKIQNENNQKAKRQLYEFQSKTFTNFSYNNKNEQSIISENKSSNYQFINQNSPFQNLKQIVAIRNKLNDQIGQNICSISNSSEYRINFKHQTYLNQYQSSLTEKFKVREKSRDEIISSYQQLYHMKKQVLSLESKNNFRQTIKINMKGNDYPVNIKILKQLPPNVNQLDLFLSCKTIIPNEENHQIKISFPSENIRINLSNFSINKYPYLFITLVSSQNITLIVQAVLIKSKINDQGIEKTNFFKDHYTQNQLMESPYMLELSQNNKGRQLKAKQQQKGLHEKSLKSVNEIIKINYVYQEILQPEIKQIKQKRRLKTISIYGDKDYITSNKEKVDQKWYTQRRRSHLEKFLSDEKNKIINAKLKRIRSATEIKQKLTNEVFQKYNKQELKKCRNYLQYLRYIKFNWILFISFLSLISGMSQVFQNFKQEKIQLKIYKIFTLKIEKYMLLCLKKKRKLITQKQLLEKQVSFVIISYYKLKFDKAMKTSRKIVFMVFNQSKQFILFQNKCSKFLTIVMRFQQQVKNFVWNKRQAIETIWNEAAMKLSTNPQFLTKLRIQLKNKTFDEKYKQKIINDFKDHVHNQAKFSFYEYHRKQKLLQEILEEINVNSNIQGERLNQIKNQFSQIIQSSFIQRQQKTNNSFKDYQNIQDNSFFQNAQIKKLKQLNQNYSSSSRNIFKSQTFVEENYEQQSIQNIKSIKKSIFGRQNKQVEQQKVNHQKQIQEEKQQKVLMEIPQQQRLILKRPQQLQISKVIKENNLNAISSATIKKKSKESSLLSFKKNEKASPVLRSKKKKTILLLKNPLNIEKQEQNQIFTEKEEVRQQIEIALGKLRRPKLDYEQYASDLYDRLKQFLTEKTSNQKKKTYFKGN